MSSDQHPSGPLAHNPDLRAIAIVTAAANGDVPRMLELVPKGDDGKPTADGFAMATLGCWIVAAWQAAGIPPAEGLQHLARVHLKPWI